MFAIDRSAVKRPLRLADHVQLSQRDSVRIGELLEKPPAPKAKLCAAARALPAAPDTGRKDLAKFLVDDDGQESCVELPAKFQSPAD